MRRRSGPREVEKSDDEWRRLLTPEQFRVLRRAGTERAFSGEPFGAEPFRGQRADDDHGAAATYRCAGCGAALFGSATKFESGTGWPSFSAPVGSDAVERHRDWKMLVPRTEVLCRRCGGHLGHVFGDGPRPTGERYCINAAALTREPSDPGT